MFSLRITRCRMNRRLLFTYAKKMPFPIMSLSASSRSSAVRGTSLDDCGSSSSQAIIQIDFSSFDSTADIERFHSSPEASFSV